MVTLQHYCNTRQKYLIINHNSLYEFVTYSQTCLKGKSESGQGGMSSFQMAWNVHYPGYLLTAGGLRVTGSENCLLLGYYFRWWTTQVLFTQTSQNCKHSRRHILCVHQQKYSVVCFQYLVIQNTGETGNRSNTGNVGNILWIISSFKLVSLLQTSFLCHCSWPVC